MTAVPVSRASAARLATIALGLLLASGGCTARETCDPAACDSHASCEPVAEGQRCVCSEGYQGDGLRCVDVDGGIL